MQRIAARTVVVAVVSVLALACAGRGKPEVAAAPIVAAAPTPVPTATVLPPDVKNFRAFCDSWQAKLREREINNTANIKWETREGKVVGEHVAYSAELGCEAREDTGKAPIGKIRYRELRYRREGATATEALALPGTVIEQADVTEIFQHAKGRWQY